MKSPNDMSIPELKEQIVLLNRALEGADRIDFKEQVQMSIERDALRARLRHLEDLAKEENPTGAA